MFISQTTDFHFANYRFSFRELQILISQTKDSHFANYRFSFRKLQIFISQTTYRFSFRKLQILTSQTTDFHFANYRFPFRKLQISISCPIRFANYSKPLIFCVLVVHNGSSDFVCLMLLASVCVLLPLFNYLGHTRLWDNLIGPYFCSLLNPSHLIYRNLHFKQC